MNTILPSSPLQIAEHEEHGVMRAWEHDMGVVLPFCGACMLFWTGAGFACV